MTSHLCPHLSQEKWIVSGAEPGTGFCGRHTSSVLFPTSALTSVLFPCRAGFSESVIYVSHQAEGRQNQGGLFLFPWQRSGVMGYGQAREDK